MNAALAYRDVRRASLVEGKTPHELTLMLFDGAISQLTVARSFGEATERAARHRTLDKALAIVHELQGSLRDPETDPLSGQLFALYQHVVERVLEANRTGEDAPLEAAANLLGTLREGWAGIAPTNAR